MTEMEVKAEKKDGYKKTRLGWIPDEWQVKKLSDLTSKIGSGTTPLGGSKVYTTKGHPFIRSQNIGWGRLLLEDIAYIPDDIHDSMSSTELQLNDVLLNITGASIGRSALVNDKIDKGNVNQHVCIIRVNKSLLNERFLNIFLISRGGQKQIEMLQAGGNRQGLNFQQIGLFKIPLPSINEQKNIVEVISSWDEAISKIEKLIKAKKRYKKGLMQRLLSGKVRFPEFEGEDWVEVKLGEVFDRVTEKNESETVKNVLTISAQDGLVSQTDYYNKSVASKDLSNYIVIRQGDFAYNKSYSEGYPLGAIKRLDDYEKGVLSPLYICFRLTSDKMDSDFITHFFEYGGLDHGIYKIAREGARNHGLLNISVKDFFEIDITLPQYEEQIRIAAVLNEALEEIELLEAQLEKYQLEKKGLMQQLLTGKVRVN